MRDSIRATLLLATSLLFAVAGFVACDDGDEDVSSQPDGLKKRRDRACGARLGDTCKKGEFCDWTLEGSCGFADATGVCKPLPDSCDPIFTPVCGCDGRTHGNQCAANALGVSVRGLGACPNDPLPPAPAPTDSGSGPAPGDAAVPSAPKPDASTNAPGTQCGGIAARSCPADQFCNLERAAGGLGCKVADATGVCQDKPEICTDQYAPVCGCDGRTYGNSCEAHAKGASIAREGECAGTTPTPKPDAGQARACGGLQGLACAQGEFCNFEGDPSGVACGAADGTGVCQTIPQGCTQQYDPVCGCNDKTYGNACEAHAAGVSVATKGQCGGAQGGQGRVSCDPRQILCKRAPPVCAAGNVPSVVGTCYGECVPVEQCPCKDAPECPDPNQYTCHKSRGRCGPYVN